MNYMVNWRPPTDSIAARGVEEEEIYKPTRQQIDEGLSTALSGGDLSKLDHNLLHFLIPPLTEKRREALCAGDYVAAQKADAGCRRVREQQMLQETLDIQEEKTGEDSHKLEISEIQLANIREKWEMLIERKRLAMRQSIEKLQADFENKLQTFDQKFVTGPPKGKLKLSPACLDLRFKERQLSYSKRFTEAGRMKQLADAMTENEVRLRTEEWTAELMMERQKLIDKERQIEYVREMAWQGTISKMQLDAAAEIDHAEKNVQWLRARRDKSNTEAEMTKTARKLPPLVTPSVPAPGKARTAR
jgi:hypothetical protein